MIRHICATLEDLETRHRVHRLLASARCHVGHSAAGRGRPSETVRQACHREVVVRHLGQRGAVVGLASAAGDHHNCSTVLADGQCAGLTGDRVVRRNIVTGTVLDSDAAFRDGDVIRTCRCAGTCQGDGSDVVADHQAAAAKGIVWAHCIACRSVGDGTASIFVAGIVGFQRDWTSGDGQCAFGSRVDVRELIRHILVVGIEDMEVRHSVFRLLVCARCHIGHRAVGRSRPGETNRNTCHREVVVRCLGQRGAVVSLLSAARGHRDSTRVPRYG